MQGFPLIIGLNYSDATLFHSSVSQIIVNILLSYWTSLLWYLFLNNITRAIWLKHHLMIAVKGI